MNYNSIQMSIYDNFFEDEKFTVKEATVIIKNNMNVNNESIRARIYEGVKKGIFSKISRGVYKVKKQFLESELEYIFIQGDGRNLKMIPDNSIDAIITDHPYDISAQLKGGNRNFAKYELFRYKFEDFKEKFRVLKDGSFLVEFIPEESEVNFEYLYEIKKLAIQSGFKYYAKVSWIKGSFVANTGRKAKNSEEILFFTKNEPRKLKLNAKKNIASAKEIQINVTGKNSKEVAELLELNNMEVHYMKGTNGMLPTQFDFQPKRNINKIMDAEKPVKLLEEIIGFISKIGEIILDQFGGSGNIAIACYNTLRSCIVIEKEKSIYEKMITNIRENIGNVVKLSEIS